MVTVLCLGGDPHSGSSGRAATSKLCVPHTATRSNLKKNSSNGFNPPLGARCS
jgi:hypothetical protein